MTTTTAEEWDKFFPDKPSESIKLQFPHPKHIDPKEAYDYFFWVDDEGRPVYGPLTVVQHLLKKLYVESYAQAFDQMMEELLYGKKEPYA